MASILAADHVRLKSQIGETEVNTSKMILLFMAIVYLLYCVCRICIGETRLGKILYEGVAAEYFECHLSQEQQKKKNQTTIEQHQTRDKERGRDGIRFEETKKEG